ncbi:MAG: membrane protein insertion efficiency factor YidD [Bacteroidales bacterium]|nr:membrane protein insertion efficiency factor YidD [Bacteroidales bacterium]MCF8333231.1 membrane protein insertion efficiency factor YidD [Bacteroidales bacterium]
MQKWWNKYLVILILLVSVVFTSSEIMAQGVDAVEDLQFLKEATHEKSHFHEREYVFKEETNAFVKYNPVSVTLGGLLYIYQNSISQQFSAKCLYHPSCSQFGKRAIAEYGFVKGIMLASDRLTRCNKVAGLDIHPLTISDSTQKSNDPVKLYR